ncbi:MAG: hypothetical protein ACTHPS_13410 [Streptosporangiaceae bacterium]
MLYEAPNVPAHLLSTLIVVAVHAGIDGKGAYISASTIAELTRKDERSAKRNLRELEKRKLIRRGNQRLVAHIRADKRPVVYNLPLPNRGDIHDTPSKSRGDTDSQAGWQSVPNGVALVLPKEVLKTSGRARESRARSSGATADFTLTEIPNLCAQCRVGRHDCGDDCGCPCMTGECLQCLAGDDQHCTGQNPILGPRCAPGAPHACECRDCHDADERDANWQKHCAQCARCAALEARLA